MAPSWSSSPNPRAGRDGAKVTEAVQANARYPFHVVSNPEFLKEGAVEDFMKPDRVVLGAETDHARSVMAELYSPFVRTGKPIIFMDIRSAELTKYAANAMLATRISFMNDIANLCGASARTWTSGERALVPTIGSDRPFSFRVRLRRPCFPKDVKALVKTARDQSSCLRILEAVEAVNDDQKRRLAEKLRLALGTDLAGASIAVGGSRSSRTLTTCGRARH
jgi:UDPglucose 6-dehydrogenase